MSDPYLGEIRMFGGNFAPSGWALCLGQVLPIGDYTELFQLIGTTYGGDGTETFALPDLQGRVPVHQGTGGGGTYQIGERAGVETVTLTVQQIPAHTHPLLANASAGGANNPTGNVLAASPTLDLYREASPTVALAGTAVGPVGGSQPHENLQPYLCLNFIIALYGVFPSQT